MTMRLLFAIALLPLILAACTGGTSQGAPTPGLNRTPTGTATPGESSLGENWPRSGEVPEWATSTASGDQPGSDQPLPEGVANGDIVDSGGILWFVWKNTRSRIWMPYAGPDGYLDTLADGPEATGRLVGAVESERASQVVVRTSADFSRVEQVYILDEASGSKREVKHISVGWQGFREIPTAFNPQYYPVLRIE